MMVRFDVSVVTAGPTEGLLNGIPVGDNQIIYVDLSSVNYAANNAVGGSITTTVNQNLTAGDVVGNVTFNRIHLTSDKFAE